MRSDGIAADHRRALDWLDQLVHLALDNSCQVMSDFSVRAVVIETIIYICCINTADKYVANC